jgi:hypothetical protein
MQRQGKPFWLRDPEHRLESARVVGADRLPAEWQAAVLSYGPNDAVVIEYKRALTVHVNAPMTLFGVPGMLTVPTPTNWGQVPDWHALASKAGIPVLRVVQAAQSPIRADWSSWDMGPAWVMGLPPLRLSGVRERERAERAIVRLLQAPPEVRDARLTLYNVSGGDFTVLLEPLPAKKRVKAQEPNLQNIPIRSAKGRELRDALAGRIITPDYAELELRVLAKLAEVCE